MPFLLSLFFFFCFVKVCGSSTWASAMEGWAFKGVGEVSLVGLPVGFPGEYAVVFRKEFVPDLWLKSFCFVICFISHCCTGSAHCCWQWINGDVNFGDLMSLSKLNGILQAFKGKAGGGGEGLGGISLVPECGEVQRQNKMQEVMVFSVRRQWKVFS